MLFFIVLLLVHALSVFPLDRKTKKLKENVPWLRLYTFMVFAHL